jgi:putative methionine-R-sulfoxide reductase with GAF domain
MLLREKNIDIYSDTVTASIYRRGLAEPVVVEDTEDSHNKYSELYAGQKRRIKSSIIYPVLSDSNQILGTIVAHCDQKLFFKEKDVKKWIEMLEIYSKKIALEKVKLDVLYDSFSGALDIKINNSPPF